MLIQKLVCEIPRSFELASHSNFRTQGSFIHISSGKIFERDLLSSDSVAKSEVVSRMIMMNPASSNSISKRQDLVSSEKFTGF